MVGCRGDRRGVHPRAASPCSTRRVRAERLRRPGRRSGAFLVFYFAYARAHLGVDRLAPAPRDLDRVRGARRRRRRRSNPRSRSCRCSSIRSSGSPRRRPAAPSRRNVAHRRRASRSGYIVHFGAARHRRRGSSAPSRLGRLQHRARPLDHAHRPATARSAAACSTSCRPRRTSSPRCTATPGSPSERGRARPRDPRHDRAEPHRARAARAARRHRLDAVDGRPRHPLADVELIEQMAREALAEARGLVAALAPVEPDAGLADALARLGERFERETGVAVDGRRRTRPASAASTRSCCCAAAQEGLANVRKHASAPARAAVDGGSVDGEVVLDVSRRRRRPRRGDAERLGLRAHRHPRPHRARRRLVRDRTGRPRAARCCGRRRPAERTAMRGAHASASSSPTTTPSCAPASSACSRRAATSRSSARPPTAREAVRLAAALERPDLVLMDLRMPQLDGAEATARILAEVPGTRVLVLTTYETDDAHPRARSRRERAATC